MSVYQCNVIYISYFYSVSPTNYLFVGLEISTSIITKPLTGHDSEPLPLLSHLTPQDLS